MMGITDLLFGWSWSGIFIAIFVIITVYFLLPILFPKVHGAPGPRPIPVLGTMLSGIRKGTGYSDIDLIKQYGKIIKIYEGRIEGLLVSDVDLIKKITIKDFTDFADRREFFMIGILGEGLFHSHGDKWRRLRHLLTPSFTSGKLRKMIPSIDTCIDRLIKSIEEKVPNKEKIELKSIMGAFTMDVIASSAFGLDIDSQKDPDNLFISYGKKLFAFQFTSPWFLIMIFLPFMVPILDKLGVVAGPTDMYDFYEKFLKKIIKERQEDKKDHSDFLQMMLDAENDEFDQEALKDLEGVEVKQSDKAKGFTFREILGQSLLFFLAAYDTTSTTMSFLIHNLSKHEELQEKLYEEIQDVMEGYDKANYEAISKMHFMEQCIMETLRMYPPVVRVDRRPRVDIDLNGVHVPANTPINIPIFALHHDEEIWPDPWTFKPERFRAEAKSERNMFYHLPFGVGPRQCIGMRLAMMEMKLALVKIIQKFRFKDAGVPIDLDTVFFLKSKNGVWAVPELR